MMKSQRSENEKNNVNEQGKKQASIKLLNAMNLLITV